MPRTGPGRKPANLHNNRHENGLVGPGKRIVKQKSNGHLNGSPKGGSHSTTPPLPASAPDLHLNPEEDQHLNGSARDPRSDVNGVVDGLRTKEHISAMDQTEYSSNGTVYPPESDPHSTRQTADVNSSSRDATYVVNPLRLATSIVKACPIQDTIALLIFLLQLPPALVTTTQYLFATLSFVPPTLDPINHLTDLSKNSPGIPSLFTVLAVSVMTIVCMLPLWTPLQSFFLDIAQVQIAITLGGGYSDKPGYFDSAFVCILVVSAMHLSQSKDVKHFLTRNVLSVWMSDLVTPRFSHVVQKFEPFSLISTDHFQYSAPGWVRLIPAGHILSQTILRTVRRWLYKQNNTQLTISGKTGDTEASAGSANQEAVAEPGNATDSTRGLDRGERLSSRKRKRQQTLVRSQQPFWAALASTKVTIMREYEHSRTSSPGIEGANAKPLESHPNDVVSVMGEEARVWILSIQPTSVAFDVSCAIFVDQEPELRALRPTPPFYLRVNGANWTSASIYPQHLNANSFDDGLQHWIGEVSGLAPNGIYQCSLVRCDTDSEFCVINMKTPAAPDTDQISSIAASHRESLRPDSPTTTMKNSIAAAEVKLSEARARIKRGRNEHKKAQASLRKDCEMLNHRLTSSGGGDEKQKQRALQMSQDIKRAEEAMDSIENMISELETIPEEDLAEWELQKTTHNTEKQSLLSARNDFTAGRTNCKGELQSHQQELNHAQKAVEKAKKYQAKLKDQADGIFQAKDMGLSEKERQLAAKTAKENERKQYEVYYETQFYQLTQGILDAQRRAERAWRRVEDIGRQQQEAAQAEAARQAHLLSIQNSSGSLVPEGNFPGTAGRSNFSPFPSLGAHSGLDFGNSPLPLSQPSPRLPFASPFSLSASARARSSSLRSGHSLNTDLSDADPIPPMPSYEEGGGGNNIFAGPPRNNSRGSGSGHNSSPGVQNSPISRGKGSPGTWSK